MVSDRIFLSAPDVRGDERERLVQAIDSNWVAPAGPDLDRFEEELAHATGRSHCVALSSGTAGLHLALETAGVGQGDTVLVSTLTFVATANAIHQLGARPIFIDSDAQSWNIDTELVAQALEDASQSGRLPKAVVTVDLYGQCADYTTLEPLCDSYGVALIADAAEALGARHGGRPAGSFGAAAVLSFNGNKIITSSGGGALVTNDEAMAKRVRHLATQAREPAPHYEHVDRGYNYRMSNVLAALGSSQLATLDDRVTRRREINATYRRRLGHFPGFTFMPEAPNCMTTFWLTALTIDPTRSIVTAEELRLRLEKENIEARPVWKPMHLQPAYRDEESVLNGVSAGLFDSGICLPSGSGMTDNDLGRVVEAIYDIAL